jgi:hypothetical protein
MFVNAFIIVVEFFVIFLYNLQKIKENIWGASFIF